VAREPRYAGLPVQAVSQFAQGSVRGGGLVVEDVTEPWSRCRPMPCGAAAAEQAMNEHDGPRLVVMANAGTNGLAGHGGRAAVDGGPYAPGGACWTGMPPPG